ncbi:MAG: 2,3-bisphosphoglycerate-independent phosphoglycerate mutase [Flavobacteriales bacterium]|nr:2,3-bisphosphoglycerate-independent phosphoglycerate mutase [Flavobacteriales bacterium]
MKQASQKTILVILDGWGHGRHDDSNAIFKANTPFMSGLYQRFPNAELRTDGEHVGLPEGQMGNSEVGHMNLGAGRIVYQDLVRINRSIRDGSFYEIETLKEAMRDAASRGVRLHLMGLVSDGGVHSHIDHLKALCTMAKKNDVQHVLVHAFTDGRDCDPHSGKGFIEDLDRHCQTTGAAIATLCGRYYAMDRDKRWERVARAYHLLVNGEGEIFDSPSSAMDSMYARDVTDEFITPCVMRGFEQEGRIRPGDVVICFNFRTDRCREITQVLSQADFHEYNMHAMDLHYVTMTSYDQSFKNVQIAFEKDNLDATLGEIIADAGKTQFRIAETEKYPHVTFFFSGGREETFPGEYRIMVPSPKVATYDLQPEMSAQRVADEACKTIESVAPDFICINFANPDMVGHTGVFKAIVKAVETTDRCLKQLADVAMPKGYAMVVLADHGNADCAVNEDGTPNTSHTTNPVPVVVIANGITSVTNGELADVAPTILTLMGLEIPSQMTGKVLVK